MELGSLQCKLFNDGTVKRERLEWGVLILFIIENENVNMFAHNITSVELLVWERYLDHYFHPVTWNCEDSYSDHSNQGLVRTADDSR